uniref:Uncharacterized protein n=1 Tax=Romanomermis culicivorax TaxID=13658 RepID=A0A915IXT8_ROMCU
MAPYRSHTHWMLMLWKNFKHCV